MWRQILRNLFKYSFFVFLIRYIVQRVHNFLTQSTLHCFNNYVLSRYQPIDSVHLSRNIFVECYSCALVIFVNYNRWLFLDALFFILNVPNYFLKLHFWTVLSFISVISSLEGIDLLMCECLLIFMLVHHQVIFIDSRWRSIWICTY